MENNLYQIEDIGEITNKIEELKEILEEMDDSQKKKAFKRLLNRYDRQLKEIKDYLVNEDDYVSKEMKEYKECSKMFVITVASILAFAGVYGFYVDAFVRERSLAFVLSGTLSMAACESLLLVGAHKKWGEKLYSNILGMNKAKMLNKKDKIDKKLDEAKLKIKMG